VGQAIAIYLRFGRPRCVCRRVFLRHRAPIQGFAHSITVSTIVRRALIRAGIDTVRKGAHLFRHYAASRTMPRLAVPAALCGVLVCGHAA
jgi:integrase